MLNAKYQTQSQRICKQIVNKQTRKCKCVTASCFDIGQLKSVSCSVAMKTKHDTVFAKDIVMWKDAVNNLHLGCVVKALDLNFTDGRCLLRVLAQELRHVNNSIWQLPGHSSPILVDPNVVLGAVPFFNLGDNSFRIVYPSCLLVRG